MPIDCITDSQGCTDCPSIPSVPYTPAVITPSSGWNSGANSDLILDGDIHTIFQIGASSGGILIGFKGSRAAQTDITQIENGFYFTSVNGIGFVTVFELGKNVSGTSSFPSLASFEIRRYKNHVTYWVNGAVFYESTVPSFGLKIVNACLDMTGDKVE